VIVAEISFEGGTVPAPPSGTGELAGPPRRRLRAAIAVILALLGLGGIAGGGTALYLEFTRSATPAEAAAAGRAEVASRWARLAGGKIFPATVAYATSDGLQTTAYRVGIAPAASCAAALDPPVATAMRHHGCVTVLRGTYLDASGTLVTSVAVAVMASPDAAQAAATATAGLAQAGVRAVRFGGTTATRFGDAQRGWFGEMAQGPYVLFYAAGYADGRPGADHASAGPTDLGLGVTQRVAAVLSGGGPPCQRKDIQC
jgi:hypothetical protein